MKKIFLVLTLFILAAVLLVSGLFVFKKEKTDGLSEKGGEEVKMESTKLKRVLFVIAPINFRDEEFLEPKNILQGKRIEVEVASKQAGEIVGMFGAQAIADKEISEAKADDYDAVVFIGGTGASVYFNDEVALRLAKTAFEQGKVVGAICIAPSILANAGILSGKKATAFSSESANLTAKGAQYTGEAVTIDGKIITARGPEAAAGFGKKIVEALGS